MREVSRYLETQSTDLIYNDSMVGCEHFPYAPPHIILHESRRRRRRRRRRHRSIRVSVVEAFSSRHFEWGAVAAPPTREGTNEAPATSTRRT